MSERGEPQPLVVVGAGGFGREVLDIVDAINGVAHSPLFSVLGVADDGPSEANLQRLGRRGVSVLGGIDEVRRSHPHVLYCIGIGSPLSRRRVVAALSDQRFAPPLVHPTATLGSDVSLGLGSVVCAGVRVMTNTRVGEHVHLNHNATVGHDTVLGDHVSVNPLAAVSGDCVIGDQVLIGAGSVILNGLNVGVGATVGGSACVVRDVREGSTVRGVPAR